MCLYLLYEALHPRLHFIERFRYNEGQFNRLNCKNTDHCNYCNLLKLKLIFKLDDELI